MQIETARSLVYEGNLKSLAILLIGADKLTKTYIVDHCPKLSKYTDDEWLFFENIILDYRYRSENIEHFRCEPELLQAAMNWIEVLQEGINNSNEILWRLWSCLWIVGFKDPWHASVCLAYLLESYGTPVRVFTSIDLYHTSIAIEKFYDESRFIDNQHCRPIFFEKYNDSVRVYGCKTDLILSAYEQPLKIDDRYRDIDIYMIVKMLQQVGIKPPNRIINKLRFRRYRLANGEDV